MKPRRGVSVPVGTVTIRQHRRDTPRAWVKIAQPSVWRTMAIHVWLTAGGPNVPEGFIIHHIDGDSLNDDLKNLGMISEKAHPQFHADVLRQRRKEVVLDMKDVTCSECGATYQAMSWNRNTTSPVGKDSILVHRCPLH